MASAAQQASFISLSERIRRECFSDGQDEAQKEEEAKIAETVLAALKKQFDSPPTADMEIVLRKNTVDSKAREIIFFPQPEDMDYWPELISRAPDGAPKDHPQNKTLICALPIFYLRHSRDRSLCKPFILAGGLAALSDLIVHENLYLRSQALESFSRLTDQCEHLDWLNVSDDETKVRMRLFELSQGTLVPNLLHNRKGSYPGGSAAALRVLAFFLSWLRHLYTRDKILYVRQVVLDAFKEWQTCEDKSKEEKDLAKTLADDFGRWPSIEERAAQGKASGGGTSVGGVEWKDPLETIQELQEEADGSKVGAVEGQEAAVVRSDERVDDVNAEKGGSTRCAGAGLGEQAGGGDGQAAQRGQPQECAEKMPCPGGDGVADPAPSAAPSALGGRGAVVSGERAPTEFESARMQTAEDVKKAGNAFLKAGDPAAAADKYTEALAMEPGDPLVFCNRALARLKMAAFTAACDDCDRALAIDDTLAKAHYRRAQALSNLDLVAEAFSAAQRAQELLPKDASVDCLCKELRTKLRARAAAAKVEKAADVDELD